MGGVVHHSNPVHAFLDAQNAAWFQLNQINHILSLGPQRKAKLIDYGLLECEIVTTEGVCEEKFVSEGHVYRLVKRSTKADAGAFGQWISDTALPIMHMQAGLSTTQKPAATTPEQEKIVIRDRQQRYRSKKIEAGWRQQQRWVRDDAPTDASRTTRLLIQTDESGQFRLEALSTDVLVIDRKQLETWAEAQGLKLLPLDIWQKFQAAAQILLVPKPEKIPA